MEFYLWIHLIIYFFLYSYVQDKILLKKTGLNNINNQINYN